MHIIWKRVACKGTPSSRTGCSHNVETTTITPLLRVTVAGKKKIAWRLGPSIRECCLETHNAQALVFWWAEVELRFLELEALGLQEQELSEAILGQQELIRDLLQERVPWPSKRDWSKYNLADLPRRTASLASHYAKVLGITWPCTKEGVDAAWKQSARKHHPDLGGSPEAFIRAKTAHTKLLAFLETVATV